jgi:cytochrome o ubiquinol oxidase subunit IV
MIDRNHGWNISFKPPILGFIFSLILTLAAFRLVMRHHLIGSTLDFVLLGLGALQVLIQLVFFLHLGMWSKPHWNMITFLFMVLIAAVIIGGTLWIISNLNYDMMPVMRH